MILLSTAFYTIGQPIISGTNDIVRVGGRGRVGDLFDEGRDLVEQYSGGSRLIERYSRGWSRGLSRNLSSFVNLNSREKLGEENGRLSQKWSKLVEQYSWRREEI